MPGSVLNEQPTLAPLTLSTSTKQVPFYTQFTNEELRLRKRKSKQSLWSLRLKPWWDPVQMETCRHTQLTHWAVVPDRLPGLEFLSVDCQKMSSKYSAGSWTKLWAAGKAILLRGDDRCSPEETMLPAWIACASGAQRGDWLFKLRTHSVQNKILMDRVFTIFSSIQFLWEV